MTTLKVAAAQPLCVPGDVAGNLDRITPFVQQAAEQGARVLLGGEAFLTGLEHKPRTVHSAVEIGDATCARLHELSTRHDIVLAVGFLEKREETLCVSHGIFFPDGKLVVERKARLSREESLMSTYACGPDEFETFTVDGVLCALTICADAGIEGRVEQMRAAGVEVQFVATAGCGPYEMGFRAAELDDPQRMQEYLKKAETVVFSPDAIEQSRRYRLCLVACNQMADDGAEYFHPGHSMIVDSTGELVGLIPGCFVFEWLRPQLICGEVHPQPIL